MLIRIPYTFLNEIMNMITVTTGTQKVYMWSS